MRASGGISGPGYDEMRAALQLHMTAPSSPLSHSASELHLPEFLSVVPMQAHLTPSPGVWKQLNSARAPTLIASDALAPPSNNAILTYELSDIVAEDHA